MARSLPIVFTALSAALIPSHASAAGNITIGTVTAVARETGAITVLSEQTHKAINYNGMDKVVVQFGSGKAATFADVAVGQVVTIEYAMRAKKPVVARLLLPDPKPVVLPVKSPQLTQGEKRGLDSKAARDNDPTTQPGSKAQTDSDITTKPGKKAPSDSDPTKTTDK